MTNKYFISYLLSLSLVTAVFSSTASSQDCSKTGFSVEAKKFYGFDSAAEKFKPVATVLPMPLELRDQYPNAQQLIKVGIYGFFLEAGKWVITRKGDDGHFSKYSGGAGTSLLVTKEAEVFVKAIEGDRFTEPVLNIRRQASTDDLRPEMNVHFFKDRIEFSTSPNQGKTTFHLYQSKDFNNESVSTANRVELGATADKTVPTHFRCGELAPLKALTAPSSQSGSSSQESAR